MSEVNVGNEGSVKLFLSADFANIEGRGLAWLADEKWKLDAFRAYDAGSGPDLYKVAASGIFGVPIDAVSKQRRQIGKVSELALGYEGGVGAFVTMAPNYGLRIADYYDEVTAGVPGEFVEKAREKWSKDKKTLERRWDERTYIPAESIKLAWRDKHPNTVATWREVKDSAIQAVQQPGQTVICCRGKVKFRVAGSFLWLQLPSGRCLCYPYPSLKDVKTPWGTTQPSLRYKGVNSFTRKWEECAAYGGMICENIIQAVARDIMAEAMVRVDPVYPLVLTVHDELVSEVEEKLADLKNFTRLMSLTPEWAEGFPIAAEGWIGRRYRK